MFSYQSLVSGALVLVIIVIADNKPMELCYRCYIQGLAGNSTPGIYRWNLPVFPGMANKAQVANNAK